MSMFHVGTSFKVLAHIMMKQAKEEEDDAISSCSIQFRGLRTGQALLLIVLCMLAISNLVQQVFTVNHVQESKKPSGTFTVLANNAGRVSQELFEQQSNGQRSSLLLEPHGNTSELIDDGENSFSACLIWMDDNPRLIEWLAYHYHVLPLRYLVIFIDPNSIISPNPVLDKWRNLMTIVQWNNRDEVLLQKSKDKINRFNKASSKYSVERYLATQRDFYRKCTAHMKARKRTWTAYIDTDEFIVLDSQYVKNVTQRMQKPGAAITLIKEAHALNITKGASQFEHNCMIMHRKEFGAVESPPQYVVKDVPPSMIDSAVRFQTLRYHHKRDRSVIGKSVMDVSKFTELQLTNTNYSAHRIIRECGENPWGGHGVQLFVNHYIGSWEAYIRPNDYRHPEGQRDSWHKRANVSSATGRSFYMADEIRPWLQGFVSYFGEERSQYLLDNVGFPYNASTALHVQSPFTDTA